MKSVLVSLILGFSLVAQAETATTSTKTISNIIKNKKFEETDVLTDSKLVAESGSLSRYSLKFSFSYYGPPVGDLSNKMQPNPDGTIGVNEVSVSGSVSGRYRINSTTALSAGTGISALTPFHGIQRTDVKNPFLNYDKNRRFGNLQIRNSFGVSLTTIPIYRDVGQYSSLSYDGSFLYNLGTSGFAAGVDTSLNAFLYERDYRASDRRVGRYALGAYPQVKYYFNDKINIYTSVALNWWNPRSMDDTWAMQNKTVSARTGLGWAINRDIYFAPFINYYPQNLRAESSTLSFSTIFSIL